MHDVSHSQRTLRDFPGLPLGFIANQYILKMNDLCEWLHSEDELNQITKASTNNVKCQSLQLHDNAKMKNILFYPKRSRENH